jgi:NAD+ kinase
MTEYLFHIFKNDDPVSEETAQRLTEKILQRGWRISEVYDEKADLNICIGGDGSFLRAVHNTNFSTIPFIGINTGHLGFYQEISPHKLARFLDRFAEKKYELNHLSMLDSLISYENSTQMVRSLNEIVIKNSSSSIVHLDIYVDGTKLESFAGDGVILSTPAGSTAYNLSAGGCILYQTLRGYQLTPLAPINSKFYRSLNRSLVVAEHAVIDIYPHARSDNQIAVISDGIEYDCKDFHSIHVTSSEKTIRKLVFDSNWYWENIKEKFL